MSLSVVATWSSSLPIAYRLYLPKEWAEDAERRDKTEVPARVEFQTKPEIALEQIRAAVAAKVPLGVVLADAAYGPESTPNSATNSPNSDWNMLWACKAQ